MRWTIKTNGEGYYWWEANVPVGLLEVVYQDPEKFGSKWEIHWYSNRNNTEPMVIGSDASEEGAKDMAVAELRKIIKKWARAIR